MAFSRIAAFDLLRRAHGQNRLAHAYLITGPAGSGKRRLVGDLAALVHRGEGANTVRHPDMHVAEPESKSRRILIDQVRALEHELQMRSSTGARKVAVIFEADRLVLPAANAFLKTLEEPPANSLLLLTSSHPEMLLETIISRCIPVPLLPEERPSLSPQQRQLLDSLERFFRKSSAGVGEIYLLIREFQGLLQEFKEAINEEHAAEFKKEEQHYKQATEGDWLEEREEYYKALTEARYVEKRFMLVDTLIQWWADILRHQQGSIRLDLPEHAGVTAKIASEFTATELLRRIAALEELRELLGRNISEALAIEAIFLRAFTR